MMMYILMSATFLSCRSQVMEFITAALQSTDLVILSVDSRLWFTVNLLFELQVPEITLIAMCAGVFFSLFANQFVTSVSVDQKSRSILASCLHPPDSTMTKHVIS